MSETTKIEWCDSTFNPWIGCTKVSLAENDGGGCDFCYAEKSTPVRVYRGKGIETWGPSAPRRRTSDTYWRQPEIWNEQSFVECMACGWRGDSYDCSVVLNPSGFHPPVNSARLCFVCREPTLKAARRRVFCASLADVFDNKVDPAWRSDLFRLICDTTNLDWLLLTKRIGNAERMLKEATAYQPTMRAWPWPNVWLGATVVNQAEADRDIPKLLATPAARRFLSIEPMLGPVSLDCFALYGEDEEPLLHWVIAGGESGAQARPAQADWFRSLRDQCKESRVPFLFKQWGEHAPARTSGPPLMPDVNRHGDRPVRVGKRKAGRMLDGREHNGFPRAAV